MIKVNVDGKDYDIVDGSTVMQACEEAGVDVPRFCYHDRLSIAGNCRMCLVEVVKSPKPVASCAMPATPGMKILTDTNLVKKAREGVMEFLLANHPLDCPICDQGGECDLQNQSREYGSDRSRFREMKRSVEDKNIGPLVKTIMTRCIHCTRCVRFGKEVCGVNVLGTTGRGNNMEIGTYVQATFDSELSGNSIDLCPVGALTSKPFAFTARPWELAHTETIDVMDAVGSNIRVDTRGMEIMRVLPRLNEDINEEWITDKCRFSYDGLANQRLDRPLVRRTQADGSSVLEPASWQDALLAIRSQLAGARGKDMVAMVGDTADAESIVALRDLMHKFGSANLNCSPEGAPLSADIRAEYTMGSGIAAIEDADVLLVVGSNPRMEAPLVASRIRKAVRHTALKVYTIGPDADLAFAHQNLGDNSSILADIAAGKHAVSSALAKAKRPMVIVGVGAAKSAGAQKVFESLKTLKNAFPNLTQDGILNIGVLQSNASRVAAQELGFVPGVNGSAFPAKARFAYLLNCDESSAVSQLPADCFVVYQGHHGDEGASRANVVLPGAAFTEKYATYMNTEGRVQRTNQALPLPGQARADWEIVRAVSEVVGKPLPYDDLDAVRRRLADVSPIFARPFSLQRTSYVDGIAAVPVAGQGNAASSAFSPIIDNYFMTTPIARSSKTMAQCSVQLPTARNSYKPAGAKQ